MAYHPYTLYQTTKYRIPQIQSICRRQNKSDRKIEILLWEGLNTLWEKEKMLVTSIFSYFHIFFFINCSSVGSLKVVIVWEELRYPSLKIEILIVVSRIFPWYLGKPLYLFQIPYIDRLTSRIKNSESGFP